MNKIIAQIVLFFPILCFAQGDNDYFSSYKLLKSFYSQVEAGKDWKELLEIAKSDSILIKLNIIGDIESSIAYEKKKIEFPDLIDSLFIKICAESFDEFPYKQSGRLGNVKLIRNQLEMRASESQQKAFDDMSPPSPLIPETFEKSLYPLIFEITELDKRESIPKLIEYLTNNSATRCVINPEELGQSYFYLSISDMAMELIEIITLCDFYDNASFRNRLFSNMPEHERMEKIGQIEKWWGKTKTLGKPQAAVFFLDSIANFGYSYIYTCNNLLSYGDTLTAKSKYRYFYEKTSFECRKNHYIGKTLSELGDDILMEDCLHDICDYRCMEENGNSCVEHIFNNAKSHIPFDVLADIVSTERFSRYKRTRSQFIWHAIFDQIATTNNQWTKSILIELLKIEDVVKGSKIISSNWKRRYQEQYEANFRVCDFALLKLTEIFPDMNIIIDWDDQESINRQIKKVIDKENKN